MNVVGHRIYLGGIKLKKKTRALKDGVLSGSSGFQGCIKDFSLDRKIIGFPEALETVEVQSGCKWEFPCTQSPCASGEECEQDGLTGHQCSCAAPPCNKESPTSVGEQRVIAGLKKPRVLCFFFRGFWVLGFFIVL